MHDVVPSGFNLSEGKGLMLGEVKGQIFGGQIGGISKVELHNAWTFPFTQRHTQLALANLEVTIITHTKVKKKYLILKLYDKIFNNSI